MVSNKKEQICAMLKAMEAGDPAAVSVVNEDKYIQHNPQTHEGSEGTLNEVHSSFYDLLSSCRR